MLHFFLSFYWFAGLFLSPEVQPDSRPNIVFIIGDDISTEDIGCYGNTKIRTPNLDRMALQGLKFTNFYLTASSCSPSRTSILTGRYPHNTGAAELHTPLPSHLAYFPELLKTNGYYTVLSGKWHEGPNTRRAYDSLFVDRKLVGDGGEDYWMNILRSRPRDKPFFFWFAPFDAHRTWSADAFRKPHHPATEVMIPPTLLDTKETRQDLASYYNEIGRIDFHIGELIKELERQEILENTILIFMADNGRPFSGSKTRVYDTGMRTPFVIQWPKGIKNANQTCESLVSSIDIAPTLLEISAIKPAPTMQGVSFSRLLRSPATPFRNYVFSEHNWHDYSAYERAVRSKDYLYVLNLRPEFTNEGPIDANQSPSAKALKKAKGGGNLTPIQQDIFLAPRPSEEFFDCRKDPIQQNNLIANPAYSKQIARLKKVLAEWQTVTGDTQPDHLTPDWYDRENGKPLPAKDTRGEMPGAAKNAGRNNHKGPF